MRESPDCAPSLASSGFLAERISGLSRRAAVQSFAREGPCLLGIFARSQIG